MDVMFGSSVSKAIPSSISLVEMRMTRVITYRPEVGDIVKYHMFGCRDKVGVVLGIEKKEMNYTSCKVVEDGCLVSFNKPPCGNHYILWKRLMVNTDLKIGTLLRVKSTCRKNIHHPQQRRVWYFGNLSANGKYITHDVLFPNGTRCIYMPLNWEVVSYAG